MAMSSRASSSSAGESSPASLASRPSGRKGNRKVKTGCLTCKVRKIKCDEARPACVRCTATGRKCDGYPPAQAVGRPRRQILRTITPSRHPGSDGREKRAIDHYQIRSATILSASSGEGFWTELVLRLAGSEPAIRHSVVALSTLHELSNLTSTGVPCGDDSRFALQEYGRAIAVMRAWVPSDEGARAVVPLLVCILFVCIEFLVDDEAAAQLHICQGRRLLSSLSAENLTAGALSLVREHMLPIYTRLSLASYLFASKPSPIPQILKRGTALSEFTNIAEARLELYEIMDEALQFSFSVRSSVWAEQAEEERHESLVAQLQLVSRLSHWRATFSELQAGRQATPAEAVAQHLLLIYFYASHIWVSMALERLEEAYDGHVDSFSAILSHAAAVLNARAGRAGDVFAFETELIAPLYWMATKCRQPRLRRAALRLLMRDELRNKRENLWYGKQAIACAMRVVEMEWHGVPQLDGRSNPSPASDPPSPSIEFFPSELVVPTSLPPSLGPSPLDYLDQMPSADSGFLGGNLSGSGTTAWSIPSNPSKQRTASVPPPRAVEISVSTPEASGSCSDEGISMPSPAQPPYGVPESRRVKNALIGPRQDGGSWLIMFFEPGEGETSWRVKREFLRV